MKLITFAIPSYNSQEYLHHAVDTILSGGEDIEIIIINDGSTDNTAAIADRYAQKYPDIVRVIHKENGGHGSGVNAGVSAAKGVYYKVVDSDDWVDEKALAELISTIRRHIHKRIEPDVYFTNFVYNHAEDNTTFVRHFKRQFPVGKLFGWSQVKRFYGSQLLLMHSLVYKTEILRKSNTVLPEHTFYVDNLFAYQPLPYCKKLFYCDINLYQYFIGRADQSIQIHNLTKRYDQQIRVMKLIFASHSYDTIVDLDTGLKRYMLHAVSAFCMNTMMFCCSGGDNEERRNAYKDFWNYALKTDPKLYEYVRKKGLPALVCWMPWKMRGNMMLFGYKVLCKINKLG